MFTRKDYSLASGFTQQQLYDFIKASLLDSGWTAVVDEYTVTTNKHLVFRVLSSGDYASRLHMRFEVTSTLTANVYLHDGWNSGTHAATRTYASSSSLLASTAGTPLTLVTMVDPEQGYAVIARQGSGSVSFAGTYKPELLHAGWAIPNTNYMPWLQWAMTVFYGIQGNNNNPWNTTTAPIVTFTIISTNTMVAADPVSALRQMQSGLWVYNTVGIQGYVSDDFAMLPGINSGNAFLDTYDVGAEKWLQVTADNFRAIALRTS